MTEQKEKKTDDPYENEEVEEMVENDEVEPEEAGFMEGYNEKQKEKPKDPKEIIQDED